MSTETTPTPPAPVTLLAAGTAITREQVPAAREQLRIERIANRVTASEFFAHQDRLAKIEAGEQAAPPKLYLTPDEQFQSQREEQMRAPDPERYGSLPQVPGVSEDTALEIDTAVREAFHRGGIPQYLAGPILEGVFRGYEALAPLTAGDRKMKLESTASRLREMWGEEFKVRKERVDDLVADMVEADDALAALFDRAPWLFHADVAAMEFLGRVADHRAGKT